MVRPRRTSASSGIGVTGAAQGLGRALLDRLAAGSDGGLLVGLDRTPGDLAGVQWRPAELGDPLLTERLDGLATVVHLAVSYDPAAEPRARRTLSVRGTAALLEAARAARVRRVVLVTGVEVYGAVAGTPVPLPEDSPLRAEPDDSLTGDLVELERLADHATRTGLDVVVLRPATLVGGALGRSHDGAALHALAGARLLAVRGTEPLWQLCHVDDLLAALELAALGRVGGPGLVGLTVGCDGWLSQREVERQSGRRRLELPAAVAQSTAERLHRLGATSGSPTELDRLQHPLVVDSRGLREAGWVPTWTNAAALADHLATRPQAQGRTGTYTTAAGATVAVVGTAALVRRARRRRGR